VRGCEVAVVGAGIVGAAVARELAVRGADVCLLDRGEVASGTTGLGEGNVLLSDKRPGHELELARRGLELYDELEERLGEEAGIRRKGALVLHARPAALEAEGARLERMRSEGVECELLGADRVREVEPELAGAIAGASFFPRDLQCAPRPIARALAREAAAAGARVLAGTAVERIERRPLRLVTGAGRMEAGAVVLAAGAWSAALAGGAGLGLPVEPRKGQLVRLERRPGFLRHKVLDGDYMDSVASSESGLQVTTVLETTADGHVLVGSSRERRGFDVAVDPAVSEAMLERAGRFAPRLRGLAIDGAWAGLRPWLPGGLPAIGPSRAVPGLWLATGHEGAGVALGPVTGRLIAQAMTGEDRALDLVPFDPDRFGERA
jgi:D-hydroxyproline dehydrogenase subunit beta